MTERPILFSGPMVRALLDGTKTQTRRILKDLPSTTSSVKIAEGADGTLWDAWGRGHLVQTCIACPYGAPGDRLWVRETWGVGTRPDPSEGWRDGIEYRADDDGTMGEHDLLPLHTVEVPAGITLDQYAGKWRPSIHMPRWVSRLSLEVIGVRVERLQDISEADAKAEGAPMYVTGHGPITLDELHAEPGYSAPNLYRRGYEDLWESINGGGSWAANPWVWVVEFKVVKP